MGTTISLTIADHVPVAVADDVFRFLRMVDDRFSTYKADSEVSRVADGRLDPSDGSPMLRAVLDRCSMLWAATDGYFDAYASGRLDPSGFVKGWAVQVASDRLVAAGAPDHCLNAGGDVRVRGSSGTGRPWRVGVRHPWVGDQLCCVLSGTDLAVATSGVYERGHHVLDPFLGAAAHGLRSVTVVGPDLGAADAYATAAVAMGVAGATWLSHLAGYETAVVTEDGTFLHSAGLPLANVGTSTH